MSKKTFEERLVAGAKIRGWKEDEFRRGKYRVFRKDGRKEMLLVGRAGALRYGRTIAESGSLGDPSRKTGIYEAFLEAGDQALGWTKPRGERMLEELMKG